MTSSPRILSFTEALTEADAISAKKECPNQKRLLLGNGFSMACYGDFGYKALYAEVKDLGLSPQLEGIFKQFGQTNFEAVLKLLDQSDWMAKHYKMKATSKALDMRKDYEMLKQNLAEAICSVHPDHSAIIPNAKYDHCYSFINNFDSIYTINYDLLLYWTSLRVQPFAFRDYFSRDEDTDGHDCEFMPERNGDGKSIYFLHGALHLYHDGSTVRKRVWKDTGVQLLTQIRTALENKQYPLVVAEGDSEDKLKQIQESSYLSNALRKFKGIQGHLFVFGSSLSDSDNHIVEVIAKNLELRHLWIGVRGGFEKGHNAHLLQVAERITSKRDQTLSRIEKKRKNPKTIMVHFFDSESAKAWG